MNGKELGRLGGFRLLESLKGGEGSQGRVFRAICEEPCVPGVEPGEIVALKSMPEYDSDGKSFLKLQKRMESLLKLQHPNIIRYRGCFSAEDAFSASNVVVMGLLEGESLAEKLKTRPTGFDV
jgi:serine/threonine protein kinase